MFLGLGISLVSPFSMLLVCGDAENGGEKGDPDLG